MSSKEVETGYKLLKYAEEELSEKKIVLEEQEKDSLVFNIGCASIDVLKNYVKKISEGQNVKEPNNFDLVYGGIVIVFKGILKNGGCTEKEIDEFCKKIDMRYKQLQPDITPYIS